MTEKLLVKMLVRVEPREPEDTILVVFKRKRLAKKLNAKTRKAWEATSSNCTTWLEALMRKKDARLIRELNPAGTPERVSS
ncbi:MAG: hypothetical protein KAJ08_16045, partial [Deltaproteobacteria bacterium]|nr:hypothetical protein [Deltaproteobacteria bacterium]